ncbi:unnamed protein product [Cyclocybe aegerita]|uniref:Palmitoyltransferase n=1 Tax=Cyclocybe aegerita TaxID=1973307 RepID=A0A8S0WH85_CYCAE|nr:unnamed protein product [Cyclocybe aegerita]
MIEGWCEGDKPLELKKERRLHQLPKGATAQRWGNYITGAAGPYFVALAVILIAIGVVCFFNVTAAGLSYPIITIPICVLITVNLLMHYYYVVTVKPGFLEDPPREPGTGFLWAKKGSNKGKQKVLTGGVRWTSRGVKITPATTTKCWKCNKLRPELTRFIERTHHCKICNRFFSSSPQWINQCVGLHNERHFVLFMAYLVVATFFFCLAGYDKFFESLGISNDPWEHAVPEIMFAMIYILCIVLCFAVGVMLSYHIYGIMWGETSVEAQDHEEYRKKAKARNEDFVNSYDLGKRKNLQFFFNIGEGSYSITTLFLPLRLMPYTDGFSWARREGHDRHQGLRQGEELTDEDDEV